MFSLDYTADVWALRSEDYIFNFISPNGSNQEIKDNNNLLIMKQQKKNTTIAESGG